MAAERKAEVMATGVGAGGVVLLLQFLRSAFPTLLWEDQTADTYLVGLVAWASGPLWAAVKDMHKGWLGIALVCVMCASMLGCVTTRTVNPDGSVTEVQQADPATIALVVDIMGQLLDRIETLQNDESMSEEERAAEIAANQARYEMFLELLQTLQGRVQE